MGGRRSVALCRRAAIALLVESLEPYGYYSREVCTLKRRIKERYASGISATEIAAALRVEGRKTRNGGDWLQPTVSKILTVSVRKCDKVGVSRFLCNRLLTGVALCFIGQAQESGRISGVVKDEAGTPIANAMVTVWGSGDLKPLATVHTDVDGLFSMSRLTPQVGYDLFVRASGFQAIALTRMLKKDVQVPIVMAAADLGGVLVMPSRSVELPTHRFLPEVPTVRSDVPTILTLNKTAASRIVATRIVGVRYPRLALVGIVQGRVELEALLSTEGTVEGIKVISGHALLNDAAKDSLKQWRFAGCASTDPSCRVKVTFVFVLEKGMCDIDQCPNNVQIDLPGTVTITSKPARAIVN